MFGKPKLKKCKRPGCNNMFQPRMSTDRFCSSKCAYSTGVENAKKREDIKRSYEKPKKPKMYREPARRTRMKTEAKRRDNYRCMLYGVNGHTCGLRREAHHIIYLSEWEVDELWNLICLCDVAHKGIAHANKGYWQHRLLAIVNGVDFFDAIPKEGLPPALVQKLRYLSELPLSN